MQARQPGLLESYNSLTDENLARHFANPTKQKFLQKMGLITADGRILDSESVRAYNVHQEHMQKSKKAMNQALVSRAVEIEKKRRADLRNKMEILAKLEQAEKIKHQARYPSGVGKFDDFPSLSKTISAHREELDLSEEEEREISRFASSKQNLKYGFVSPYAQEVKIWSPKASIPSARSQLLRRPSSVPPPPPSMPPSHSTPNSRVRRTRLRRTHTAPIGTRTNQFNHIPLDDKVHTNIKMTMQYLGMGVNLEPKLSFPVNVQVHQQHCGGNTICLFDGDLRPNGEFTIVSRRHFGSPLGLSLYIDRLVDSRLSSCCEYKYNKKLIVGRSGHFKVVRVEGGKECYQCQGRAGGSRTVDKSKAPPKLSFPSESDRSSIACECRLNFENDATPTYKPPPTPLPAGTDDATPIHKPPPAGTSTPSENEYGSDFEDTNAATPTQKSPPILSPVHSNSDYESDFEVNATPTHKSDLKDEDFPDNQHENKSHTSASSSKSSLSSSKSSNRSSSKSSSKSNLTSSSKSSLKSSSKSTLESASNSRKSSLKSASKSSLSSVESSVPQPEDQQQNNSGNIPLATPIQSKIKFDLPAENDTKNAPSAQDSGESFVDPRNDTELKKFLQGVLDRATNYHLKMKGNSDSGGSEESREGTVSGTDEGIAANSKKGDTPANIPTVEVSTSDQTVSSSETSSRSSSLEKLAANTDSDEHTTNSTLTDPGENENGRKNRIDIRPEIKPENLLSDIELKTADEASDEKEFTSEQNETDSKAILSSDEAALDDKSKPFYVTVISNGDSSDQPALKSPGLKHDDSTKRLSSRVEFNKFLDPSLPVDPDYTSDANYDYISLNELKGPVPVVNGVEKPPIHRDSRDEKPPPTPQPPQMDAKVTEIAIVETEEPIESQPQPTGTAEGKLLPDNTADEGKPLPNDATDEDNIMPDDTTDKGTIPTDTVDESKPLPDNAVEGKPLPDDAAKESTMPEDTADNGNTMPDDNADDKGEPLPDDAVDEGFIPDNIVNEGKPLRDDNANEGTIIPSDTIDESKPLRDDNADGNTIPDDTVNESKPLPDDTANEGTIIPSDTIDESKPLRDDNADGNTVPDDTVNESKPLPDNNVDEGKPLPNDTADEGKLLSDDAADKPTNTVDSDNSTNVSDDKTLEHNGDNAPSSTENEENKPTQPAIQQTSPTETSVQQSSSGSNNNTDQSDISGIKNGCSPLLDTQQQQLDTPSNNDPSLLTTTDQTNSASNETTTKDQPIKSLAFHESSHSVGQGEGLATGDVYRVSSTSDLPEAIANEEPPLTEQTEAGNEVQVSPAPPSSDEGNETVIESKKRETISNENLQQSDPIPQQEDTTANEVSNETEKDTENEPQEPANGVGNETNIPLAVNSNGVHSNSNGISTNDHPTNDSLTETSLDDPTGTPSDTSTSTPLDNPTGTPSDVPTGTPLDDPTGTPDAPTGTPDAPTGIPDAPTGTPDAPTGTSDGTSATPLGDPNATPSADPSSDVPSSTVSMPVDGTMEKVEANDYNGSTSHPVLPVVNEDTPITDVSSITTATNEYQVTKDTESGESPTAQANSNSSSGNDGRSPSEPIVAASNTSTSDDQTETNERRSGKVTKSSSDQTFASLNNEPIYQSPSLSNVV